MRKLKYLGACALMSSLLWACNDDEEPKDVDEESYCGDDVCDADETPESCPADCEEENGEGGNGEGNDTGGISPDADVCVATYDLEALMAIEGTSGGLGDATADIPGQLALRYVQSPDDAESPAADEGVEILHFFINNEITVQQTAFNLTVDTAVYGFTPTCNGETDIPDKSNLPEPCAFDATRDTDVKAIGVYNGVDAEITWDRCRTPEEFEGDPKGGGYTPEHESTGPGCLKDYHSQGNVHCDNEGLCSAGDLEYGDNIQDSQWNQPLETFTLSADGGEVSVERIRLPNAQPSSTYLSFTGTRVALDCGE